MTTKPFYIGRRRVALLLVKFTDEMLSLQMIHLDTMQSCPRYTLHVYVKSRNTLLIVILESVYKNNLSVWFIGINHKLALKTRNINDIYTFEDIILLLVLNRLQQVYYVLL